MAEITCECNVIPPIWEKREYLPYVCEGTRRQVLLFFFCNRPALSSDKALGFTTRSLHQCCRAQYTRRQVLRILLPKGEMQTKVETRFN